ncbi:hypothetical protein KKF82_08030 [Patescibacteria group bacterium]|uniref:Uncharacterized protein n=1 Tax=viral metagenome TaxID=1070528 RepID=A0A6M3MBV4_9ZZZZ|nr:hypothetical protein [Patescibacteria group bacterium]
MSEIRDRVKGEIKDRISERHNIIFFEDDIDYILSIPELAIVDRNANKPLFNCLNCAFLGDKEGWVKEVK